MTYSSCHVVSTICHKSFLICGFLTRPIETHWLRLWQVAFVDDSFFFFNSRYLYGNLTLETLKSENTVLPYVPRRRRLSFSSLSLFLVHLHFIFIFTHFISYLSVFSPLPYFPLSLLFSLTVWYILLSSSYGTLYFCSAWQLPVFLYYRTVAPKGCDPGA